MVNPTISITRLQIFCSLVFFCFSCSSQVQEGPAKIYYKNGVAEGITLRQSTFSDRFEPLELKVFLDKPGNETAILGEVIERDSIYFKPLIPLTPGKTYLLTYKGNLISQFTIPEELDKSVSVVNLFPTQDTVPFNLLKMHLQFSEPMGIEHSDKYVEVRNEKGDSIASVFLSLNPELWNEDRTMITLWLDPGRIKRGLIPNETLGAPLEQNKSYTIVIHPGWKARSNSVLKELYTKTFFVSDRDSISPSLQSWSLIIPKAETKDPMEINFKESLDFILIQEAISISYGELEIQGQIDVIPEEKGIVFHPESNWRVGEYIIQVESRLEDLAGNNLNRLFETDKTQTSNIDPSSIHFLKFIIDE